MISRALAWEGATAMMLAGTPRVRSRPHIHPRAACQPPVTRRGHQTLASLSPSAVCLSTANQRLVSFLVPMPSITLHPPAPAPLSSAGTIDSPLPQLLHTPSGLALLEIQGTVHFPTSAQTSTQVGKLVFPLYSPTQDNASDTKWMKRVYLYVGKGQRLTGECKKLPKPIAIVRKRERRDDGQGDTSMGGVSDVDERDARDEHKEELEIVEVVKYKIIFSARPEPISGVAETG